MKLGRYVILILAAICILTLLKLFQMNYGKVMDMVNNGISVFAPAEFAKAQSLYPHVKEAKAEKEVLLEGLFNDNKLEYPPEKIFLRAFKNEQKLELWVKSRNLSRYTFLKKYNFEKLSGRLGPKRKEGDLQVPEGFYYIDRYNPASKFYLSLGINYPNESDRILSDKSKPGSDIFIHGGSASVGCIPVGDENIKEIYLFAVEARANGQEKIPVHIFPSRFDDFVNGNIQGTVAESNELNQFWQNLKEGFALFEREHIPPEYEVDKDGRYIFTAKNSK